tara:strand:- start:121 stop:303 length:183 start_codon:yes stop_codon:yes gene_type:complete
MTTADLWVDGTAPNLPALIGAALAPMLLLVLAVGLAWAPTLVVGIAAVNRAWDILKMYRY